MSPNYRFWGGNLIKPGLPNIKGRSGWSCHSKVSTVGETSTYGEFISGAFVRGPGYNDKLTWGSGSTDYDNLDFDASASNPIYGASDTVQPPAYTVFAWLRVR